MDFNTKKLLWGTIGTLSGMVVAGVMSRKAGEQGGLLNNYKKEIAGTGVGLAGSYLMSQKNKNYQTAGLTMAGAGGSLLAKGVYDKVQSGNILSLPSGDNGENGEQSGGIDYEGFEEEVNENFYT